MKILALSGGKDSMACLYLMREELDGAIYVDTGYTYPETQAMIAHAETLIPVHRVSANRQAQQDAHGIPFDVVPVEWTAMGQAMTSRKPFLIQSPFQCCFENIVVPLHAKARELGATHIVSGQRQDESHRATSVHGQLVDGFIRLYPLADWTAEQTRTYLASHMDLPAHFAFEQTSLDCYDCPAYRKHSHDRVQWTKARYPEYYAAYARNYNAALSAVEAAL